MRSQLPGRVRHAVAEALQEHPDPDTTVLTLRAVVENKVGVNLTGKYGVLCVWSGNRTPCTLGMVNCRSSPTQEIAQLMRCDLFVFFFPTRAAL